MRFLSFLAALAGTLVLHGVGVRFVPEFASVVDLFVVLVVFRSLDGSEVGAQLEGAAIGFVHDALSGGPFGLFGVASTLTGYLVAIASRRFVIRDPLPLALVFILASAIHQAIALGLSSFFLASTPLLTDTVLQMLASGVLGLTTFFLLQGIRRRYHLWRHRRKRRLL